MARITKKAKRNNPFLNYEIKRFKQVSVDTYGRDRSGNTIITGSRKMKVGIGVFQRAYKDYAESVTRGRALSGLKRGMKTMATKMFSGAIKRVIEGAFELIEKVGGIGEIKAKFESLGFRLPRGYINDKMAIGLGIIWDVEVIRRDPKGSPVYGVKVLVKSQKELDSFFGGI